MGISQLKFTDNEDGTMKIEATHAEDFDPVLQSHSTLKAIVQFLPQILAPAGTIVHGDLGIRTPITDGDRYQALRALALMSEAEREAINNLVEAHHFPETESGFDELTNKIVMICRGANEEQR